MKSFVALVAMLVGFAADRDLEMFDAKSEASVAVAYAGQLQDVAPAPMPPAPSPGRLQVNAPACANGMCQLPGIKAQTTNVATVRHRQRRIFNGPRSRGCCSSCR